MGGTKKRADREAQRKAAKKKIAELFEQARIKFKEDSESADRAVLAARRLSMKYRLSLPEGLRRRICKNCYKFLVPSVNCRIRLNRGKRVVYCFGCRKYTRVVYKK